jgi:hypothetical protein
LETNRVWRQGLSTMWYISTGFNQWWGRGNSDWCRIPRILWVEGSTWLWSHSWKDLQLPMQSVPIITTRVLRVNHRPFSSHWQTLSHNVHLAWAGFELATLVVIGTDCIGSCKSFQLCDHNHVDPSTQRILGILHQSLLPLPHHWLKPDWRKVGGLLWVLWFPQPIKLTATI